MTTTPSTPGPGHVETVIIGAGQAGLSTGYHLQRLGRSFVILDGAARVGDQWRQQWDTLRLYSPAGYDGLPGLPFPGDRGPSRARTRSRRTSSSTPRTTTSPSGSACGSSRSTPRPPAATCCAPTSAPGPATTSSWRPGPSGGRRRSPTSPRSSTRAIVQLHSSEYRRPGQLREGRVLVVGASHSGTDIAYDVAQTHPTTLCGRDCGEIPIDFDSWIGHRVFPLIVFAWRHVITRRTPIGPQGDGPHPQARRPDDPRQAAPTSRSAASSG